MDLALELRELADRFSEGWHDGIKIDASDIMLLSMAASQIEQTRSAPVEPAIKQGWDVDTLLDKPVAPVQEPVACPECNGKGEIETGIGMMGCTYCPPAAQRQWVGLTDEEIYKIDCLLITNITELVMAIEAKLRSKNGY
jgi:hypothetical protein